MENVEFRLIRPDDQPTLETIADWYLSEWAIPPDITVRRLQSVTSDSSQFHVVALLERVPIAAAGLHTHVGLLDSQPRLNVHRHWLALVYTVPEKRHQGFGALLCQHMEERSKRLGIDRIHLFTDTAMSLYRRLGWSEVERLAYGERTVTVMSKEL